MCSIEESYLVCGTHEDVVGDFAEGQAQINDIVLGAAALGEVTDMDHTPRSRFPLHKLERRKKQTKVKLSLICVLVCHIILLDILLVAVIYLFSNTTRKNRLVIMQWY